MKMVDFRLNVAAAMLSQVVSKVVLLKVVDAMLLKVDAVVLLKVDEVVLLVRWCCCWQTLRPESRRRGHHRPALRLAVKAEGRGRRCQPRLPEGRSWSGIGMSAGG